MNAYAVIRIKGHRRIRPTVRDTLQSLRLTRANHCVLLAGTPDALGQLQNAKDYITFGPIEAAAVASLIRSRGRLEGDRPVTDEAVAKGSKYKSIEEFAAAIARGEVRYQDLKDVKPLFRLSPPRKGFKGGIKRSVGAHGNLGNRGAAITPLLERMI